MTEKKYEEIEFVYTNVNVEELRGKLEAAGATFVFDETYDMTIFDYPGWPLDKDGAWVRLRRIEGKELKLAYKKRLKDKNGEDNGMKEVEFDVADRETAKDFLLSLGMVVKKRQEKRRIRYALGEIELDIDFWPLLEPSLEIEGKSEKDIDEAAVKIGLDPAKKRIVNNFIVYKENGIDLHDYKVLTFSEQEPYKEGERGD